MPAALVAAIDWATLREAPEKIHDQTLRLLVTDTLFEVALLQAGHRLFVLPEHKSYVDREAPGQILRYSVHVAHSTRANGEPPALVVPILLCHGETAWPELEPPHPHLQQLGPEATAVLAAMQPGMHLLIDDLERCTERGLRRAGLTPLAQLTFCAFASCATGLPPKRSPGSTAGATCSLPSTETTARHWAARQLPRSGGIVCTWQRSLRRTCT